jgi:hypothetical protein
LLNRRLCPNQEEVLSTTRARTDEPAAVPFDGTNVRMANAGNDSLIKAQVSTGSMTGSFTTGDTPRALAYNGANIRVAGSQSNTVTTLRACDGTARHYQRDRALTRRHFGWLKSID